MKTVLARETRRLSRITASGGSRPRASEDDDQPKGKAKSKARGAEEDDDDPDAEDDDVDAEDEDTDAEDEDQPKGKRKAKARSAEDDEDDTAAEDDDDAPAASVARERKRCAGLTALSKQADRLGVNFSASKAIARGTTVAEARRTILNAAADGDRDETSAIAAPKNRSAAGGRSLDAGAKQAAWKKALKR